MKPLPSDSQRCHGAELEECRKCYRFTTPYSGWPFQTFWTPPDTVQSPCPMFLKEPEDD